LNAGQPQRTRRRTTTKPAVLWEARMPAVKAPVSRVRNNLTHGSTGGGRKPTPDGIAAERQAPPAYPANPA